VPRDVRKLDDGLVGPHGDDVAQDDDPLEGEVEEDQSGEPQRRRAQAPAPVGASLAARDR
jgi:hypothetical protein